MVTLRPRNKFTDRDLPLLCEFKELRTLFLTRQRNP